VLKTATIEAVHQATRIHKQRSSPPICHDELFAGRLTLEGERRLAGETVDVQEVLEALWATPRSGRPRNEPLWRIEDRSEVIEALHGVRRNGPGGCVPWPLMQHRDLAHLAHRTRLGLYVAVAAIDGWETCFGVMGGVPPGARGPAGFPGCHEGSGRVPDSGRRVGSATVRAIVKTCG
jgi:hypothetical protein